MPTGKYAITEFHADVVDEHSKPVPLSEVYLHHWLVFNKEGNAGEPPQTARRKEEEEKRRRKKKEEAKAEGETERRRKQQ